MSHLQTARQVTVRVTNKFFKNVAKFKYSRMTVTIRKLPQLAFLPLDPRLAGLNPANAMDF
jgi:hypothetical protein